mmetsp:Transcript_35097/g.87535  ORF Transcript_35097/g.87535 Transcript_35097/m.87535 type:complete len:195 (-) Transcript_35097:45-629(-)
MGTAGGTTPNRVRGVRDYYGSEFARHRLFATSPQQGASLLRPADSTGPANSANVRKVELGTRMRTGLGSIESAEQLPKNSVSASRPSTAPSARVVTAPRSARGSAPSATPPRRSLLSTTANESAERALTEAMASGLAPPGATDGEPSPRAAAQLPPLRAVGAGGGACADEELALSTPGFSGFSDPYTDAADRPH